MGRKSRGTPEINAGSMADIAFLLLIFFLVTTTMDISTGLQVGLPPPVEDEQEITKQKDRDVLKVLINSQNVLLVEGKRMDVKELKDMTVEFLTNPSNRSDLPLSPEDAIVSLKNDRGTSYETYVRVYDELKRGYSEVRNAEAQRRFGKNYDELGKTEADQIKDMYPQKISEAEPENVGGE